jgi:hypothetical protein
MGDERRKGLFLEKNKCEGLNKKYMPHKHTTSEKKNVYVAGIGPRSIT